MAYLNANVDINLSLVMLKNTGVLGVSLAKALYQTGFDVVIANPNKTNQFAKPYSDVKTDNQDTKMLTLYAKCLSLDEVKLVNQLYINRI